jgi:adenine phosphoribosyltransferase
MKTTVKAKTKASAIRTLTPLPAIARPIESFAWARSLIRDVPDFPKEGILFKDITPLLAVPRAFHVDAIVGIEARGFIFGGALAARLNASFVPARKPGKLPASTDRVSFATEYSTTELEMHKGSLRDGARVLIVDDVLATGGTARAAADLVKKQRGSVVGFAFVIELGALGGRDTLGAARVESILTY